MPTGDGLYAPCPCVLRDGCVGVFAVWSIIVCLGCGFPWGKVNVFFCKNAFFMFFSQNMCWILRASAFLPGENRAKQGRRCLRLGVRLCAERGGGVCGWGCGCARRGSAAFAVGSAVVRGEGRRRLRLGVRLCAERVGGVCGWECGCVRRGAAAFAVGSAVVRGEGRRRLRLGVRLCTERGGDVCVLWWVVFRMVPCICLLACLPSWRGMTGICWARCVVFRVPRALRILAPWCVCSC